MLAGVGRDGVCRPGSPLEQGQGSVLGRAGHGGAEGPLPSPEFPTNVLEMNAVASIFDMNGDGFIDYYEFVSALHPNRDPLRRTADADQIQDEVRQGGGGLGRVGVPPRV